MSLKSDMICNICKLFLKNPITLPCFCVVCNEHSVGSTITCVTCDTDFDIPKNGFVSNKMATSILEKELHLTEDEKKCKAHTEDLVLRLEQLRDELKVTKINVGLIAYDHFSETRRKIDLQRESFKARIDTIALEMIDQTNEQENLYKQRLSQLIGANTDENFQSLQNEFRNPNLVVATVNRQIGEHEAKATEFRTRIFDLSSMQAQIKAIEFCGKKSFQDDSFGSLKLANQPRKLVSCSEDHTIKIWDLESTECVAILKGHTEQVMCLEFLEINRFISGSLDGTIKIWNAHENVCIATFEAHPNGIICLKSLTRNRVASGSLLDIKIWSIFSGECLQTLHGHAGYVRSLASLSDDTLISGSDDKSIKFWDLSDGSCTKTFSQDYKVYCLLVLENGLLASGSRNYAISTLNVENGECVQLLSGHTSDIWKLHALQSDTLISCSFDKSIRMWDLPSGKCIKTLEGHTDIVRSIKVLDKNLVASCSGNGIIKIWNIEESGCVSTFQAHESKNVHDLLLI